MERDSAWAHQIGLLWQNETEFEIDRTPPSLSHMQACHSFHIEGRRHGDGGTLCVAIFRSALFFKSISVFVSACTCPNPRVSCDVTITHCVNPRGEMVNLTQRAVTRAWNKASFEALMHVPWHEQSFRIRSPPPETSLPLGSWRHGGCP